MFDVLCPTFHVLLCQPCQPTLGLGSRGNEQDVITLKLEAECLLLAHLPYLALCHCAAAAPRPTRVPHRTLSRCQPMYSCYRCSSRRPTKLRHATPRCASSSLTCRSLNDTPPALHVRCPCVVQKRCTAVRARGIPRHPPVAGEDPTCCGGVGDPARRERFPAAPSPPRSTSSRLAHLARFAHLGPVGKSVWLSGCPVGSAPRAGRRPNRGSETHCPVCIRN